MQRPDSNEYKPFAERYIQLVPEGNFMELYRQNTNDAIAFFSNLPANKHEYRYAEGKWTLKEMLMHIADTERVMNYRALTGIRGDRAAIMYDMDQDLYAAGADVSGRTWDDILEEFAAVRTTGLKLFGHITSEQSRAVIHMIDGGTFTVRALGYINIGHMMHHMNIINERYL
ncbi:MAG: DinB family protein [Chitinophagaceae bacterium]|nr:DinB family protein [Chitinophagaceae bacterium]